MATKPIAIQRSLPAIVCDLSTTRQRLAVHYARPCDPTEAQDRDWSDLEDRKTALEAEFDAAIYDVTGVSWQMLEGARA